jgi:FKBP12-rapamycin complex-associated protein
VEVDIPAHEMLYELSVMRAQSYPTEAEPPRLTPSSNEYYPRVAINALMKILRDSTLSMHHPSVTQAIMFIFQILGMQCVFFLNDVIPFFFETVRKCGPGLREVYLPS